jgi:hypothetical protein
MDYHESMANLIGKVLERCIKKMCIRLHLGFADWDLDERLRKAIETHPCFQTVSDLVRTYDETLDQVKKSGTKIESKYFALERLRAK